MKMYIAVREDFPDYMTPTLVAHAVLRHDMFWGSQPVYPSEIWKEKHHREYMAWKCDSFKKVVLRASQQEYNKIRVLYGSLESWENNTLNGEPACVTVVVDEDVPNVLKFAKLWKPKDAP